MKTRLMAILVGLALAGSASAQRVMPPEGAAPVMPRGALGEGVPPLPPGCRSDLPSHRDLPDLSNNSAWRNALGVSDSQAAQVQQLLKQRRAEDEATCAKLRSIVGDKAMSRWLQASMPPPPPPPRPPMPPQPPEPPQPPMPMDAGQ